MHGGGARAESDGIDVANIAGSTNTSIPSIESYEYRYPVLYLERGLVPDSEGAGQFSGGRAGYWARCLYGVDSAADCTFYIGRDVSSVGVLGGKDGSPAIIAIKRGACVLERLSEGVPLYCELDVEEEVFSQMPPGLDRVVNSGDVIYVRGMGGAGFGSPALRREVEVRRDLAEGLLSEERAEEVYGVKAN